MAISGRRVERLRGAAESSGSDEGNEAVHAGVDANMSMDFIDADADPGEGLMMGEDDDLGVSSPMFYFDPCTAPLCCFQLSGPV